MTKKKWQELQPGNVNSEAGNSIKEFVDCNPVGPKPDFHAESCVHCLFCWLFCPENAIITHNSRITGINYDFCNGCGICVAECPVHKDPMPLTIPTKKEKQTG